jgi:hypothetical protein
MSFIISPVVKISALSLQVFSVAHQGDGPSLHGRELRRSTFTGRRRLRRRLVRNLRDGFPHPVKSDQGSTWFSDKCELVVAPASAASAVEVGRVSVADSGGGTSQRSILSLRSTSTEILQSANGEAFQVSMLLNVFSASLMLRPNKIEGLSLETLSSQVLEFEGKARANPIGAPFRCFLLG